MKREEEVKGGKQREEVRWQVLPRLLRQRQELPQQPQRCDDQQAVRRAQDELRHHLSLLTEGPMGSRP